MERIFFDPLLNNYRTLAKEMGVASPGQVRDRDIGAKLPSQPKSKKKILQILRQKKEVLDQIIQDYEALWKY